MIRRPGRPRSVVATAVLVALAACSPGDDSSQPAASSPAASSAPASSLDPTDAPTEASGPDADFDRAVAAEGGVVPLVANLTDVGTVESAFIARTPDVEVGVWRLLAREGGDGRPLVSFEIETDVIVDVRADRVLSDGRPVEIDGEGRDAWIRTVAEQGHSVEVVAPDLDVDDTLAVVDGVVVDGDELVVVPDGWVEAGSVPIPSWIDGHTTDYVLVDGRRCSILVERRRGDREALARFGPTAPVDLGTGDWAYRIEAAAGSSLGYVFEYGDDLVVNVTGDLTDAEFRAVIGSLRELRPGESVILEPGASSSA